MMYLQKENESKRQNKNFIMNVTRQNPLGSYDVSYVLPGSGPTTRNDGSRYVPEPNSNYRTVVVTK